MIYALSDSLLEASGWFPSYIYGKNQSDVVCPSRKTLELTAIQ